MSRAKVKLKSVFFNNTSQSNKKTSISNYSKSYWINPKSIFNLVQCKSLENKSDSILFHPMQSEWIWTGFSIRIRTDKFELELIQTEFSIRRKKFCSFEHELGLILNESQSEASNRIYPNLDLSQPNFRIEKCGLKTDSALKFRIESD